MGVVYLLNILHKDPSLGLLVLRGVEVAESQLTKVGPLLTERQKERQRDRKTVQSYLSPGLLIDKSVRTYVDLLQLEPAHLVGSEELLAVVTALLLDQPTFHARMSSSDA